MVSDLTTLAHKGCKIAAAIFYIYFFYNFIFFIFSLRLNVFLPPFPKVQYPNFLNFGNQWGKVMERSDLIFKKKMLVKGVKWPRKIKISFFFLFFFCKFCLTSRIFLVVVLLSASVGRCFVSCMQDLKKKYKMHFLKKNTTCCIK